MKETKLCNFKHLNEIISKNGIKTSEYILLLNIEKRVLLNIAKTLKKNDLYDSTNYNVNKIMLCTRLIDIIILDDLHKAYVNTNNIKRFFNTITTDFFKKELSEHNSNMVDSTLTDIRIQKALSLYNKIRTHYMTNWSL